MLIGEKVCLGPVLNGDAPLLFNWFDSIELVRTSGPYRPTDEAKFNQWIVGAGQDPSRVLFAIRKTGDLRLLGYVHLSGIHPVFRCAELGIAIGAPADRRQGYGSEAMRLAVAFCWRELNLQRVSLAVLSNNPDARRLYARAGFEAEGLLRRAAFADGGFRDVTVMAVLRPDGDSVGKAD
jgi:RimJ/RimL family protein N-acetyltransferase